MPNQIPNKSSLFKYCPYTHIGKYKQHDIICLYNVHKTMLTDLQLN